MKFGRDNLNEKFSFGNKVLAEASDFRFSGIQMDNRLKLESHFKNVCGKLAKFNGLLFKAGNCFSENIFVMQKRVFKTICFKRNFASYIPTFV